MSDTPRPQRTPREVKTISAGWQPNPRRILWPFLLTLVVVAGTWTPPGELRDAATRDPAVGMRLVYSDPYIWGAPWFDLLEALGMLTWPQHWALVATVVLVHVAVRAWRLGRGGVRTGAVREVLLLLATTGALGLGYATAALVPRPMPRLVVFDRDILVLDVRANAIDPATGGALASAQWRRRWSARAGFHAAYVDSTREALGGNPARAGDGFVVLPAIETARAGQVVAVLSPDGVAAPPVVVQALPFDVARALAAPREAPALGALQINDGSATGLTQALAQHDRLVRLADSLNLPLVAGSHHRGWGSTAVAWTLVRLPGWQQLAPDALARAIAAALHDGRRRATQVIERRTPELEPGPRLALIGPLLLYELNATLSPSQRLSWICWIWGLFHLGPLGAAWLRGRRVLRRA